MMPTATDQDRGDLLRRLINRRAWQGTPAQEWAPRAAAKLSAGTLDPEHIEWAIAHLEPLPVLRNVPEGRYMLDGRRRYRVVTPTKGRWAGRTSVYAISAKGAETLVTGEQRRKILGEIGTDVLAAAIRYGQETGRCPYCKQALDHPTSIRVGMGERCARKRGLPWK